MLSSFLLEFPFQYSVLPRVIKSDAAVALEMRNEATKDEASTSLLYLQPMFHMHVTLLG